MELLFRDIVKLIHPDYNPSIIDASTKMTTVIQYRDNPRYLHTLAISWGLIQEPPTVKVWNMNDLLWDSEPIEDVIVSGWGVEDELDAWDNIPEDDCWDVDDMLWSV